MDNFSEPKPVSLLLGLSDQSPKHKYIQFTILYDIQCLAFLLENILKQFIVLQKVNLLMNRRIVSALLKLREIVCREVHVKTVEMCLK